MDTPASTPPEILMVLRDVARPIILSQFAASSCILSTRVAILALDYFQVRAEPMACAVYIFNAPMWERMQDDLRANRELAVPTSPHEWSVGLGVDEEAKPGHWPGHLVAIADRWLIDLSLDQGSRPQRGMALLPSIFPLPEDWRNDGDGLQFSRADGLHIVYRLKPKDRTYRRAPDWKQRDRLQWVMPKVITLMRTELARREREKLEPPN